MSKRPLLAAVLLTALAGACGGDSSTSESSTPSSVETTAVEDTTSTDEVEEAPSTLPPGATAGLDDYDDDGELDPTCGTQDFGGGLILRIPCEITTASEPANGTTLVQGSLARLPTSTGDVDLTGTSASLILARDQAGAKVRIFFYDTGALFETGSDVIESTDILDATTKLINGTFPGSAIQVRGHTDATGTASANQGLSERRAASVAGYLRSHAIAASSITSVGFGSTRPLTLEKNPDGSTSDEGQRFNRRVEVVLRVP